MERMGFRMGCQRAGLLLAGLLLACGGGSGSGQGASTAASEGTIAGFGSVIMNGVRWNTDDASFEVEGEAGTQDDLSVGMVVRIEGRRLADGSARAERVEFDSRLRGPIRQIEELGPDARVLHVFGIRSLVSRAGTRFDGIDLDSLTTDLVVELSGYTNGAGELEATYLRRRNDPIVGSSEVKAFGVVTGLAGGSFVLGTSEVLFDATTVIDDLGPGGLRDGLEVRVEGILLANDGIRASEIESPRHARRDDDFDEHEIQGIVSDFVSLGDFRVAGRRVDANGARLEPNEPDLLRDGVRVEVEGRFDRDGILVAEKVQFRSNRVRIHAEVADDADVDVAADRLWLLGIPIQLTADSRQRDQRDAREPFGLEDVTAGDFLEIRGIAHSDGTVTATELERRDHDGIRLRGPVDSIQRDAGLFTILGVPIPNGAGTQFQAEDGSVLTASQFYDRLTPGSVVQADDREDGDETEFDFADEVELETPHLEDLDGPEDEIEFD